ncbi:HTH domain-containing protein [Pontibacter sp. FD36]|uniref:HTH domain-containing protein n=1 Tax=Pontibacter sp. FD36 TaxID=2789860 RepID=UPI0018A95C46|nr:HTH domain-containing protein [Pontibacter sp. FD36]MBF8964381.1 HTH domain-containing protein [Pontibacter sp. FD36]
MNFRKYIERIKYLDELIRKERTGTPEELASRLGVSRAQLYNIIDELKTEGLAINYTRKRNTFYYTSNQKLEIAFSLKVVSEDENIKVFGGKIYSNPIFLDGRKVALYQLTG